MKTGGAGMINGEAIKIIDALIFQAYLEYEVARSKRGKIDINNRYNALTIAKEALEKQIPKKPDLEGDGYGDNGELIYDTGYCPDCRCQFEVDYDVTDYCPECGQALDWSDIDE